MTDQDYMEQNHLELLRRQCEEMGQSAVARQLDYSASAISQILGGKYKGNLKAVLNRVEEVFGQTMIKCPLLGNISLGDCSFNRRRPFAATNPMRVKLYRECQVCDAWLRR